MPSIFILYILYILFVPALGLERSKIMYPSLNSNGTGASIVRTGIIKKEEHD